MSSFKKASEIHRERLWLKATIEGLSGSGKTTTALRLAMGLAEVEGTRIAVVDTEHGRSLLEAEWCDFDHLDVPPDKATPEALIKALQDAQGGGYRVVVFDSLSAEWEQILAEKDRQPEKERFTGWGKLGPRHQRLLAEIQRYPGHVIVTLRSKQRYEVGDDKKVRKLGVEPIARGGTEYEFDVALTVENAGRCLSHSKPPRGIYGRILPVDETWNQPGAELGRLIAEQLRGTGPTLPMATPTAEAPTPPQAPVSKGQAQSRTQAPSQAPAKPTPLPPEMLEGMRKLLALRGKEEAGALWDAFDLPRKIEGPVPLLYLDVMRELLTQASEPSTPTKVLLGVGWRGVPEVEAHMQRLGEQPSLAALVEAIKGESKSSSPRVPSRRVYETQAEQDTLGRLDRLAEDLPL